MDKEYLENYRHKEQEEIERFLKKIREGRFSFEKDRFPQDDRFVKLQKPVAFSLIETPMNNLWPQIPFCGSLIFLLPPFPKSRFEKCLFSISQIPEIINFIKETGRLQVAVRPEVYAYQGYDYLDPFFKELNPPVLPGAPMTIFGNDEEIQNAINTFSTLGKIRYFDFLKGFELFAPNAFRSVLEIHLKRYVALKLAGYTIAEEIENFLIDDPEKAASLIDICGMLIVTPMCNVRADIMNTSLEEIKTSRSLPLVYQPRKMLLKHEIGKFLIRKLTYAPTGLDASKELIYHYDACDLRKILESLNEAILTNHPDIIQKSVSELSEILDDIWKDAAIPRRVKGLKVGIPVSMAAIGSVAAGPIGAAGGFLTGLGFNVAHKFIDVETTGLSERIAKLRTKSYQANIYDFKKKYKAKVTPA